MATTVRPQLPSPTLIPNSNYFFWRDRTIHLPRNIANTSLESKKGFMQILKNIDNFSFRKLSAEEKEAAFNKGWQEIVKSLPPNNFTKSVMRIVEIAGIAFLIIIGSKACL